MASKKAISKVELQRELLALLTGQLEVLQAAHRSAAEGSTHEEARAEHSHDTRATEQSYLARGQAKRVEELASSVAAVRGMPLRALRDGAEATLGALVTLADDGKRLLVWLAPAGGGSHLAGGVLVTTPGSFLGQELLGKELGDSVVARPGDQRELTITRIE